MDQLCRIEYTYNHAFGEGFALLIASSPKLGEDMFEMKVQRLWGDWMDALPWHEKVEEQLTMPISTDEAIALHSSLSQAKILAFPPVVAGVDGERHELVLSGFFNVVHFQWFMELPDCWSELKSPVQRLTELARQCLATPK